MKKKPFSLRALPILLTLALALSLTACAQDNTAPEPDAPSIAVGEPPETNPAEDTQADTDATERTLTDMAGRSITVPAEIERVFTADSIAAIYLYTASPDKLLGWNYQLNELERRLILPEYQDLPVYGMVDSLNYEAVIAAGPQVALLVAGDTDAARADADSLSEKLGVPVAILSDQLEQSAAAYRFLGELLGIPDETAPLAAYIDQTFADLDADIPEAERIRVYYGNGPDSLETAPRGSIHAQVLELAGALNVADLEVESGGRIQVSVEQLLAWAPSVIITSGEPKQDLSGNDAAQKLLENPVFASVQAVQDGRVFGAPKAPFSWIDRPRGPNRVIGLRWLAVELYPERYDYDIETEVRTFYHLFYHIDLTDTQYAELFQD